MPTGPKGQKRPADVIGAAIMTARIATGEIEESPESRGRAAKNDAAISRARQAGLKGGPARAQSLSREKRTEISRKAARKRWEKK